MAKAVAASLNGAGSTFGTYGSSNILPAFGGLTPPVPLTTVLVRNGTGQTVSVVITGGTMSNVSINGVTVGSGAGTYTLPESVRPQDGISMAYSAAPTWVWSAMPTFTPDPKNAKHLIGG